MFTIQYDVGLLIHSIGYSCGMYCTSYPEGKGDPQWLLNTFMVPKRHGTF